MDFLGRLLKRKPPAPKRARLEVSLANIPGAWEAGDWVPEWPAVETWLTANRTPEQHPKAWWDLTASWLYNLADELGSPYVCFTTQNFHVLCPYDETKARPYLDLLESSRKRLIELFSLDAALKGAGPGVVLMFYDREEYLNYISNFPEPLEQIDNSCGVALSEGYSHLALYIHENKTRVETTVATELTRTLLGNLPTPLWLVRGLARVALAELGRVFEQMKEIRLAEDAVRECWGRHGIKEFWSGSAFSMTDERKRRANQLAEILTRSLLVNPKAKTHFGAFLAAANQSDGGEAAALEHLGAGLGHWAGEFLGPGDWTPRLEPPVLV